MSDDDTEDEPEDNRDTSSSLDELLDTVTQQSQDDAASEERDELQELGGESQSGDEPPSESTLDDLLRSVSGQDDNVETHTKRKDDHDTSDQTESRKDMSLDDVFDERDHGRRDQDDRTESQQDTNSERQDFPLAASSGDAQGDKTGTTQSRAELDWEIDPETLQDASDILILRPTTAPEMKDCTARFSLTRPEQRSVLFVSLTEAADKKIRVKKGAQEDLPAEIGIVSVSETIHTTVESRTDIDVRDMTIETVANPGDLAGLGLTISKTISQWESANQLVVCFRSITALLQYAELESVFRFLHVLQDQFNSEGAIAHYHMNADAHDRQTISTLRSLFDAVIEVSADGHVKVTRP